MQRARQDEGKRSGFTYNFSGAEFWIILKLLYGHTKTLRRPGAYIAKGLNIPRHELKIFDPYYCRGGVKKHLQKLGFSQVYNENERFLRQYKIYGFFIV